MDAEVFFNEFVYYSTILSDLRNAEATDQFPTLVLCSFKKLNTNT